MAKKKQQEKFKVKDRDENGEFEWEGEDLYAESTTQLSDDKGTGVPVVIRCFDFAANPTEFRRAMPDAQILFDSHRKGMETLLWKDGLVPYTKVEPRLMVAKDGTRYRIVIACVGASSASFIDKAATLSEALTRES